MRGDAVSELAHLQSTAGNRAIARWLTAGRPPARPFEAIAAELARPGRELDPVVRAEMEPELGYALGEVRVHRDGSSERAAAAANATAFTVGNHVVFGRGAYDPGSAHGRHVLAHELVHVLQRSRPGSLGLVPPGAQAEQQASRGVAGAGAETALARMGEKDLTQLDDAQLQAEYDLALQSLADHPTGADRDASVRYVQEIEESMLARSTITSTQAPSTASVEQGPAGTQSRNYQTMPDETLAEHARNADTEAGAEIFSRARIGEADTGMYEELGPEVEPEFIGPVAPDYRSGQTPLREGDIDRYGAFNTPSRVGDRLAGHEVLQNAFLKATGQILSRGVGPVSRNNPSLAVSKELHLRIDAAQRARGLWDSKRLAGMTDEEVIARNVAALEEAGVERSQIVIVEREAVRHAAEVRGQVSLPDTAEAPVESESGPTSSLEPEDSTLEPESESEVGTSTPPEEQAAAATVEAPSEDAAAPSDPVEGVPDAEPSILGETGTPLLFFGGQLALGYIHARAKAERIRELSHERGWVPYGAGYEKGLGGILDRAGDVLLDPGDTSTPASDRFDAHAWRANMHKWFDGHKPGDTVDFTWDVPPDGPFELPRHEKVTYTLGADGKWRPDTNGDFPDVNRILDPSVSDRDVHDTIVMPDEA